jgi:hypothetical protein
VAIVTPDRLVRSHYPHDWDRRFFKSRLGL